MTTAYTSLLGLALPVQGELQGTWGDTVNNAITSLLDTAVAGTTTLSTDGDVTLTTTTGAANQARQAILLCSGARTAARNITAPAQSKIYTVINATTGGFAVVIRGVGPTTGVTVPAGQSVQVAWNGSDFVDVSNSFAATGTANGVVYLNGSKVPTTGTALTFDGTNFIAGTTSSGANIRLGSSSDGNNGLLRFYDQGGARRLDIYAAGSSAAYLSTGGVVPLAFAINDSEQMRLTSTGLGIGTSSPSAKLHVQGGSENAIIGDGTRQLYFRADSGGVMLGTGANQTGNGFYFSEASNFIYAQTNSVERMRITSAGDVGIGTSSPSTYSAYTKLAVLNGVATATNSTDGGVYVGATTGGTELAYLSMGRSYNLASTGEIALATTGSKAILFGTNNTERARIDSSGNVLVNTTLAFGKFAVQGASTVLDSYGQISAITSDAFAIDKGGQVMMGGKYRNIGGISDYCAFAGIAGKKETATDGGYGGYLQFLVSSPVSGNIERARFTSSGVLAIGTTTSSSTQASTIEGQYGNASFSNSIGNAFAGNAYYDGTWRYKGNSTASLVIQDSNWLHDYVALAGTTGAAITWQEMWRTNTDGVYLDPTGIGAKYMRLNTSSGGDGHLLFQRAGSNKWQVTSGGTDALQFYSYVLGSEAARIDSSGNFLVGGTASVAKIVSVQNSQYTYAQGISLYYSNSSRWTLVNGAADRLYVGFNNGDRAYVDPSNGTWNALSDLRLKKDIQNIRYGLAEVLSLRAVEYRMNDQKSDAPKSLGFIAQEALEVIPESVSTMLGGMYGMDKTSFVPVLVKAIQELKAEFDAYKATHP